MEYAHQDDHPVGALLVIDVPRDVRGRGQDHAAKRGRALSLQEHARGRVPIEQLSHADQVGAKPVDPGSLTITSQPRELTTDMAEKIGMAPDATSHPGALARALRASEAVASCFVEDRVELRIGHPTRVTGLDLFPCGPGLGPLPLFGRLTVRRHPPAQSRARRGTHAPRLRASGGGESLASPTSVAERWEPAR